MSSSTSQRSRFRQAVGDGLAMAVPMNGLNCVVFSQTPCIGTDGLGSCSVVLIVSQLAAILAHIPPRPNDARVNDPEAGDRYTRSFMERVTTYYRQCQSYFPANSSSWVVCAVFGDTVALPDQQKIMESALRDVGLTVDTSQTYRVPFTNSHRDRGTVFVDGRGPTVQVYMEDRVIRSISPAQSSHTTAFTSTAVASSSHAITQHMATPSVATAGPASAYMQSAAIAYTAPAANAYTAPAANAYTAPAASAYTQPVQQQSLHKASATIQQNAASTPQWEWDSTRNKYYWINIARREYVYQDGTTIRY